MLCQSVSLLAFQRITLPQSSGAVQSCLCGLCGHKVETVILNVGNCLSGDALLYLRKLWLSDKYWWMWHPTYHYVNSLKPEIYLSFIPLTCAECDDSLPFSGASSIPLCYSLFPAALLHQIFFHPLSPHLVIYFLVYLSVLLFPNSYVIPFWEFYFLPFSVHAQINKICLTV